MTDTLQQRISKIRLRASSAALTLAVVLALGVVATASQAWKFSDLYNFTGSSDGGYPFAPLIMDKAGNLYGTTYYAGSSYCGTVFKVDTSFTETVLYNFTCGADGGYPYGGLVMDKAGNLYGTTYYGGSSYCGVVFKVDTSNTETVLHSFTGGTTDGCYPFAGLVMDKAGNLYGTTSQSGASGYGTVFEVDTSDTESVLYSFAGGTTDGCYPYAGLVQDKAGNFYGVTEECGASGAGTVWKLSKKGTETVLYSFTGGSDGGYPIYGAPIRDSEGNLYDTTEEGGTSGYGTVWKLSKNGTETVLHSFDYNGTDGAYPLGSVAMDKAHQIYGTTESGGTSSYGIVFKIDKKGVEFVEHNFGYSDGGYPFAGPILDAKGNLYGTTYLGGTDGYGTVWKITK